MFNHKLGVKLCPLVADLQLLQYLGNNLTKTKPFSGHSSAT